MRGREGRCIGHRRYLVALTELNSDKNVKRERKLMEVEQQDFNHNRLLQFRFCAQFYPVTAA